MDVVSGLPVLTWRPRQPVLVVSSAPLGGGLGLRRWLLNATVPAGYTDPAPERYAASVASRLGLDGEGTGLLTAVDVRNVRSQADNGVRVHATTGVGMPIWAASDQIGAGPVVAGTINVVARFPVRLSEAALVNAVATVAEAKAQALLDSGVDGTGTCTDATILCCPADGPAEAYGGPRSVAGSALARAVHAAVGAGLRIADPGYWGWALSGEPVRRPGAR
ncbi:adenosylcobinamide amidohydrolase [Prauserella marina]|nr:adenosylcobinamide amidohydrolase [Prauserella marina]